MGGALPNENPAAGSSPEDVGLMRRGIVFGAG